MRRISSAIEEKAVEMWFSGYPRESIAQTLGIGESTISDMVATFPLNLQTARDIAVACQKNNTPLARAWKGLKASDQLESLGVPPEKVPSLIRAFKKISTNNPNYSPELVMNAYMKLSLLEEQSGKEYPHAIVEFEAATKTKNRLDKENQEQTKENSVLQKEIEKNRQTNKKILTQAKTTQKELSNFLKCRQIFKKSQLETRDTETIHKILDNIEEAGGDPTRLVSLIKKHSSLTRTVVDLEKDLTLRKDELSNTLYQIGNCRQEIMRLRAEINQFAATINSQRYTINRAQENIVKLETRKKALITLLGHKMRLSQEQIALMLLDSEFELFLESVDNAVNDLQKSTIQTLFH